MLKVAHDDSEEVRLQKVKFQQRDSLEPRLSSSFWSLAVREPGFEASGETLGKVNVTLAVFTD